LFAFVHKKVGQGSASGRYSKGAVIESARAIRKKAQKKAIQVITCILVRKNLRNFWSYAKYGADSFNL
jgi:hypothetical protein